MMASRVGPFRALARARAPHNNRRNTRERSARNACCHRDIASRRLTPTPSRVPAPLLHLARSREIFDDDLTM